MKDFIGRSRPAKSQRHITILPVTTTTELMKFLIEQLPSQGRNNIKSLLSHRQISVDGHPTTKHNYPLQAGQEVSVNWSLIRNQAHTHGLKIVYEDEAIIVIDKPAGLLSMASDQERINTAYHQLTDHVRDGNSDNRIFIVHRLDRDTSGLMMFAKSEAVKHKLQDNWKTAVTDRAYLAVVEGRLDKPAGTVKSWLLETKTRMVYSSPLPGDGLEAITHYRVLQTNRKYSLLEVRLDTGRKNQIRVHMKDIGHPIIGDKKYGSIINPIGRLGLHAHILSFYHPATEELLQFETEIPQKFSRLFAR